MKLDGRRIEAFLRDPGQCRVALLYGDDAGLIRERAGMLVRAAAGSLDDPFRVTDLGREGHGRISSELASAPLTGGRRVVRVREAGEALGKQVQAVLDGLATGLLVLEAEGLAARGKLRALVERAEAGAAIGCYGLGAEALERVVEQSLRDSGVSIDNEALAWTAGHLGRDLGVTRRELDKLALYAGAGGRIDLAAARSCIGDLADLSLDDALFAATGGDVAGADRALELAVQDGANPVGVLRAALLHMQRLQRVRASIAGGESAADAIKQARPPVFFGRSAAFQRALRLWSEDALQAACVRLWEAERLCKTTGSPAETICRSAFIGLAQRAASQRR